MRPVKKDPNQTRITICGTNVCYPGDVGKNTASLKLFKLMINGILSRAGYKYVCFDIEFFYLSTLLGGPEYVKIQLSINSSKIHHRIQPKQLSAQRLGIF